MKDKSHSNQLVVNCHFNTHFHLASKKTTKNTMSDLPKLHYNLKYNLIVKVMFQKFW